MGPYLVILGQLIFTILLEGSVMIIWQNSKEALGYSILANLMTNPALNLILMIAWGHGISGTDMFKLMILLEIAAVILEMLAYLGTMRVGLKKAFFISLALNLFSFTIGSVFGILGYWDVLSYIMQL